MAKNSSLNKVIKNLEKFGKDSVDAAEVAAAQTAIELQTAAKQGRSWRDRTGNATRSITGSSARNGNRVIAALAIGVSYGVYLELAHAGRFSIIGPTLRQKRDLLAKNVKRATKI